MSCFERDTYRDRPSKQLVVRNMDQFCTRRIDLTPINYFLRPETRYHHPHQSSHYDAFLSQARDHCFTRLAKMRRNTVTYWRAVFANRETCSLIRLYDAFRKTLPQAARKKPRKLTDHGKTTSTTCADFKFNTVKPVLSGHHQGMLWCLLNTGCPPNTGFDR